MFDYLQVIKFLCLFLRFLYCSYVVGWFHNKCINIGGESKALVALCWLAKSNVYKYFHELKLATFRYLFIEFSS